MLAGLGCDFLTKPCTNNDAFPYTCQGNQIGCTFDRISKVWNLIITPGDNHYSLVFTITGSM